MNKTSCFRSGAAPDVCLENHLMQQKQEVVLTQSILIFASLIERLTQHDHLKDPVAEAPGLKDWERELLRDCEPASRLGDIRPIAFLPPVKLERGTEGLDKAIAHATLGFKALHNFW